MSTVAQIEEPKQRNSTFQRVLMAADFSNASERALGYAVAIAGRYDAELLLVHAISPTPREPVPMDSTPRQLDRERLVAEREMQRFELDVEQKNLAHRIVMERGPVWDVLSFVINRDRPDLLILGTHGRGALGKLALGSVAEEVLRLARCPVLTVGPKAVPPRAYPVNFECILFASDFGPASAKAFPYALSLAEDCKAKLILLHLVPPMAGTIGPGAYCPAAYVVENLAECENRLRAESLRKLEDLVPSNAELASKPECVVVTDFLPDGILEIAAMHKADLIVLGISHTWSARLVAHMPGVVIHDVLCKAKYPVLTVKD